MLLLTEVFEEAWRSFVSERFEGESEVTVEAVSELLSEFEAWLPEEGCYVG